MEDGVDGVVPEERRDQLPVAQIPDDVVDVVRDPLQLEAARRGTLPVERSHLRAALEQRPGEPGPRETTGAGDKRPHRAGSSAHTRQGGSPESQRSLSITASL
jgi:hypothetical protein